MKDEEVDKKNLFHLPLYVPAAVTDGECCPRRRGGPWDRMRRFPQPVLRLQEEANGKPSCDLADLDLSPGSVQQTCPWSLESPEDATFLLFFMLYLASCKIPSQFSSCPRFSIWLEIFLAHTYHPNPQCSSPHHQQVLQKFKRELEPFLKAIFYHEFYPTLCI